MKSVLMKNYIYIATSLDGYIATKEGGLDWLSEIPNPDQSDFGFGDFLAGIDCIVMGRNTYEKVLTFDQWPYPKKVFVLSNSLKEVPAQLMDKVELVSGNVNEVIETINRQGFERIYVDGGKVIQSFLKEDLIDEMIITRIPVILGGGIPLFGELSEPVKFTHVKTEVLAGSMVKSYYSR